MATNAPNRSFRVPKTAELVAAHLRRQIVRGELLEGEMLPTESALMAQFSVSRPTLREAFRVLESEGLITVRRGTQGGARVHVPSVPVAAKYAGLVLQHAGATLAGVLEARTLIEPPLAAYIAARSDRKKSARALRKYLKENALSPADPNYTLEFHGFNRLLMSMTGNEAIVLVTSMLEAIADEAAIRLGQRYDPADTRIARLVDQVGRTRRKLADLIEAGDADAAEQLWRRHLEAAAKEIAGNGGGKVVDLLG